MPDFEINSTLNYYKWYHHIINVLEVAVIRDITNTESLLKIIPDFIYLSFRPVMIMFRRYFFFFSSLVIHKYKKSCLWDDGYLSILVIMYQDDDRENLKFSFRTLNNIYWEW